MQATHAVEVSDSVAFILPKKDLLGRTRLFEALAPYREKYNWWGYHLLCHFMVMTQRQLMQDSSLSGVPIPWNALKKSLPWRYYYLIEHTVMLAVEICFLAVSVVGQSFFFQAI